MQNAQRRQMTAADVTDTAQSRNTAGGVDPAEPPQKGGPCLVAETGNPAREIAPAGAPAGAPPRPPRIQPRRFALTPPWEIPDEMWKEMQALIERCRHAYFNELRAELLQLGEKYGYSEERMIAIGILEPRSPGFPTGSIEDTERRCDNGVRMRWPAKVDRHVNGVTAELANRFIKRKSGDAPPIIRDAADFEAKPI